MITPVLLCGGSGTRLWPLSRKSYPKQFAPIVGDGSLFQQTGNRYRSDAFAAPIVVTNADSRFVVVQQLIEAGINPGAILSEPEGRNTAPALLAAALHVMVKDPDGLILATPSDHYVQDNDRFLATIESAKDAARAGQIVTFGITPDRPETGFGYLELDSTVESSAPVPLKRFVEKPDFATAEAMLKQGGFLWNAGVFLYTAQTLVAAFETHMPQMLGHVRNAIETAEEDLGFLRLAPEPWAACEDISIDYSIMEKVDNLSVAIHQGDWSDMGGWDAVYRHGHPDDVTGVSTTGSVTAIDCSDTLLRSEADGLHLVGFGLEDIVVVAMPDAVLVADRNRVQDVGNVVKIMRKAAIPQADTFPKDHRPWGFFETLILSPRFQVKRIVVNPGAALSLQSHVHRSEHWIVVSGTAKVTIDEDVRLVSENQSVYIPLGAVHRMENPGKVSMELIEVQTGAYLGEDDIIRYEDIYSRN